jgi:hypothetical protein
MTTDEVHARFAARDPLLLVALYRGDARATAAVARMLRLVPLPALARHQAALVEVLAALPEMDARLRHCWSAQHPAMTATLFGWVEQARQHVRRAGEPAGAAPPPAWVAQESLAA